MWWPATAAEARAKGRGRSSCGQRGRRGRQLHFGQEPDSARQLVFQAALWPFSTLGWPDEGRRPICHLVIPTRRAGGPASTSSYFWVRGLTMLAGGLRHQPSDEKPGRESVDCPSPIVMIHGLRARMENNRKMRQIGGANRASTRCR